MTTLWDRPPRRASGVGSGGCAAGRLAYRARRVSGESSRKAHNAWRKSGLPAGTPYAGAATEKGGREVSEFQRGGNEVLRIGKDDHPPRFAASSEYVESASSHFTSPDVP